ncbi:MAG: PilW family protein [Proteobacteria bacterium]|nr:PilW family protein [Pseudomonadota bacterium]
MKTSSGFSLVELLIALLISALMTIVMGNVFIADQVASKTQEGLSEVQTNGRIGVSWLKFDLRMAGNTSRTYSRSPIRSTTTAALAPLVTNNCFTAGTQAFDWGLAILPRVTGEPVPMVYGVDNVAASNTVFSGCISGADLQVGTDMISVHYADTEDVTDAGLVNGVHYINSGLGGAVIFRCNASGVACRTALADARTDPSGTETHPLVSRVYFIRRWANTAGDGIPTLARATMRPNGTVVQEALIPGVTSMQILYGIDTNNDGNANQYVSAAAMPALNVPAGLPAWTKIKAVQISILAQSTTPDSSRPSANQTFNVGGTDVALAGAFVGKVYATTVAVRNPSARTIL